MARRKRLLGLAALAEGNKLLDIGVPMTRVHTELQLDWSYQATVTVFNADRDGKHHVTRPAWLSEEPTLQETPEGWGFEGVFPNGQWVQQ
jgi:hypothetical protein